MFKHGYSADFGWFWLHDYFRFGKMEGLDLPTWNHLWFVAYLWVYTVMLALVLLLPERVRAAGRAGFDRVLGGGAILFVPLALLALRLWLGWPAPEDTHDVVGDLYAHTLQLPLFLFGYLLRDAPAVWRGIRAWWRVAAVLAVAAYVVVALIEFFWPGDTPAPDGIYPLFALGRTVQMWTAIVALLGIADRYWNHDHRWRTTLTEAVFPFYIIHQTIIVVAGWYLLRFALPAGIEFAALVAVTTAGCWLFYLVGRCIPPLRPLIGLRMR